MPPQTQTQGPMRAPLLILCLLLILIPRRMMPRGLLVRGLLILMRVLTALRPARGAPLLAPATSPPRHPSPRQGHRSPRRKLPGRPSAALE
jgi:hypothetical protein